MEHAPHKRTGNAWLTAGLLSATTLGMALFSQYRQNSELTNTLNQLNNIETVAFTSVKDCMRQGYTENDCTCSLEKAVTFGKDHPVFTYTSAQDAAAHHTAFDTLVTTQTMFNSNNDATITTETEDVTYVAKMMGWQAPKNDICKGPVVNLVAGSKPGELLRADRLLVTPHQPD